MPSGPASTLLSSDGDLHDAVERSANPHGAALALERVVTAYPDAADRIVDDASLREALVAVLAASPWLTRVCVSEPEAIDVLAHLDRPILPADEATPDELARTKELGLLRIAARDLVGLDPIEAVGSELSTLAGALLGRAIVASGTSGALAVIGVGKLGAGELNYSSDVDLLLVSDDASADPRAFLNLARSAWRVDLDLRPEGRPGPLVRSLASYVAYWERWAETWEFQALLKAHAVAGSIALGVRFEEEAASRVWGRPFGADELRQVRTMKARSEDEVRRQGLSDREIKKGKGGIRDIEFAVQLLQLVHGRDDPGVRARATVPAIASLVQGGYIAEEDAAALDDAYRFLRNVEHRLQLFEGQQVHTVPAAERSREHLARVLDYRDQKSATALSRFDADLRRHQATVRWIHERLFFRPLLEAFTDGAATRLPADAAVERLSAFGFADAERTVLAVRELTRGLSRSSRLMDQLLPMLFDWLSQSPDPDLGLLGLRTLADGSHQRDQLMALCRESPEAARQLCELLGTGARFARTLERHPDLLAGLASGETLAPRDRTDLDNRAASSLGWRTRPGAFEAGLQLFGRAETLRIAARDVLGLADVEETGRSLADLAEAVVAAAVREVDPPLPFAIAGMGRLGGRELAYSSDLDLMFVYEVPPRTNESIAASIAESAAIELIRIIGGSTPAAGLYRVDTALRPEGRQGPLARSIEAYRAYYSRWAQPWERQALLRGRIIAGDEDLGARFHKLASEFVWDRPLTSEDVREIRRSKARIEKERLPASDDPTFHLKLGPGSLSDVEWTAQLLQLEHGVMETSTLSALDELAARGWLARGDHQVLSDAYRFCEQTRNRLGLISDVVTDGLPTTGPTLTVLARSLGTTASDLRDDYRRLTRRARRVVERLFYGQPGA